MFNAQRPLELHGTTMGNVSEINHVKAKVIPRDTTLACEKIHGEAFADRYRLVPPRKSASS